MEIVASILKAIEVEGGKASKTKIMYRAFLSFAQLKEYMAVLMENKLISLNTHDSTYSVEDKGRQFMRVRATEAELVKIPAD